MPTAAGRENIQPRRDRRWAWACAALGLVAASCSDSGGLIVDAAVRDGAAADGSGTSDAGAIDGPDVDATAVDAVVVDAAEPDAVVIDAVVVDAVVVDAVVVDATAVDAVEVDAVVVDATEVDAPAVDAAAVVPDAATMMTDQSVWTAASGMLPDALCVPWTLVDTSTPEQPFRSAGQLTLGNDVDGETMYYAHPEAVLAMPAVLVIEAGVRLVASASQTSSRSGASISFAIGATDRKNSLFIDDGVVFLLSSENTRGPSAAVATTDAAHLYRIELTVATSALTVSRDGIPILAGTAFVSPYDVTTGIYFGEGSVVAHGTSAWAGFRHNALAPTACP